MTLSTAISVPVVLIPGAWEADGRCRIPRTLWFRPRRVAALSGRARLGVLRLYSPGSPVRARVPHRVLDAAAAFYRRCLEESPAAARAREWLGGLGMGADVQERWRIGFAPPGGRALAEHLEKAGVAPRQAADAGLVGLYGDAESWNKKEDTLTDRPLFPVTDGDGGVLGFASDDPMLRHAYRPYDAQEHIKAILVMSDQDRDTERWDLDPSPRLRGLMVTSDSDAAGMEGGPVVWTGSALEAIAVAESGIGATGAAPGGRRDPAEALRFLWRTSPEPVLLFGGGREERERARETLVSVLPILGRERTLRIAFAEKEWETATFAREGGRPVAERAVGGAMDVAGALWELVIGDGTANLADRRGEAMRMAATVNDVDMRRELWTALGERFGREYGSGRLISFPARPVAAPKEQDDPAARPIGDALSRGFAIQLACAITERVGVDSGAHDIDLEIVLAGVLARANADSAPFDDREREAATGIAALRAEADLRARVTEGTGLPKGALYASRARILGYPGFADPDMERLWKGTVKSEMERLGQEVPPEPLPLDMMLARSARLRLDAEGRTAVDAATGAMGLGAPRDLDRILDGRERTGIFLSDETALASAADRTLWREARELYRTFTARHIRAMVLGTAGAGFGPEAMGRIAEGVARLHGPGPGWFDGPPAWSGLYRRHRDLAVEMGNDRGAEILRAGLDRGDDPWPLR